MRDLMRWFWGWMAAGEVVVIEVNNLDVEIADHAKYMITVSDHAKHIIALSDRTRGP